MLALLIGALVAPAQGAAPELIERKRELEVMGTALAITACGADAETIDAAIEAAIAEIQRVEDVMTDWRPSPLMRLNEQAGKGPVAVPAELARMIARALEVGRASAGAFDVTYAAVGELWDFKADPPLVPSAEAIEEALTRVGWDEVQVDLESSTVDLPAGMSIGLGGIAKGFGVDRAMAVLMEHGIEGALVNAGGDLKALGRRADGNLWEIAIKHPRERERVLASLPLANVCVVTSGDYERFFELDGKRYHHILDPRSGYPSRGCMSATVVGPDAALADALATAVCVLGPEKGLELIESIERTEALVVGMDGEVQLSSGLEQPGDR